MMRVITTYQTRVNAKKNSDSIYQYMTIVFVHVILCCLRAHAHVVCVPHRLFHVSHGTKEIGIGQTKSGRRVCYMRSYDP